MLSKNIKSKLLKEFADIQNSVNAPVSKDIDAVVVLSGESADPQTENDSFDTQQRTIEGIKIYKEIKKMGGKPTLVLTGTMPQNKIMIDLAFMHGVKRIEKLTGIPRPPLASTLIQFKQLRTLKVKSAVIVTHATHGPRVSRYAVKYWNHNSRFQLYLLNRRPMRGSLIKSEVKKIEIYSNKGDIDLFAKVGKIIAIIQARMTSTRLPGKTLMIIKGMPMLAYVIKRIAKSKYIDDVIVATSVIREDDAIVEYCRKNNVSCFRGDLEDVLSRYYKIAKKEYAKTIVRITSDCPLIDCNLVDIGLEAYKKSSVDYVSNTLVRSYPRGLDFEVFSFEALEKAFNNAKSYFEREHVTPYIGMFHKKNGFKVESIQLKKDKSEYRITVDTKEDYEVMKLLIEKYNADSLNYMDIIKILDQHPEIAKINKMIKQKNI